MLCALRTSENCTMETPEKRTPRLCSHFLETVVPVISPVIAAKQVAVNLLLVTGRGLGARSSIPRGSSHRSRRLDILAVLASIVTWESISTMFSSIRLHYIPGLL